MAINPNSYFNTFPKISYPLEDGTLVECVDIMVRHNIADKFSNLPDAKYVYHWKDTDKPHLIAHDYYGDVNYGWLVMLSGELFDWLYDFPLPNNQFNKYLISKYGKSGVELTQVIHHYERQDGTIIDEKTYLSGVDLNAVDENQNPDNKEISIYDHEFNINESRRSVTLISNIYASTIRNELTARNKTITELRKTQGG